MSARKPGLQSEFPDRQGCMRLCLKGRGGGVGRLDQEISACDHMPGLRAGNLILDQGPLLRKDEG